MLIEQEKSLLGSKEPLEEETLTVTLDLLIKFSMTKNEMEEMVLSKNQPQQIGKDCFKSAYCYNCHSHCVKNSYLHSKPACNCLLFRWLFAENDRK